MRMTNKVIATFCLPKRANISAGREQVRARVFHIHRARITRNLAFEKNADNSQGHVRVSKNQVKYPRCANHVS